MSGDPLSPRPQPPRIGLAPAVFLSLIAAVIGFAACLCAMRIADVFVSKLPQYSGLVALEGTYAAPGCFVGWLIFLLPVAMAYSRKLFLQRLMPMCLAGAAVGVLLTAAECMLFFHYSHPLVFAVFAPCGAIDAVVAAATLILMLRRYARQYPQGA